MTPILLVLFACGGGTPAEGTPTEERAATTEGATTEGAATTEGTAAGTEAAVAGTEAAPAAGAVTGAMLAEANTMVHPMQPWAEAEAALKGKLGDPKVEGDNYSWIGKDGDTCQVLTVSKMGDSVGSAAVGPAPCP
jgi:hypothetical protein